MTVFVTSDLHLGHENIISFAQRPFSCLEEMHEKLRDNWNSVVKDSDTVYVLGDVVWHKTYFPWLATVKGHKRLVMGNHDTFETKTYLQYFEKLHGAKFLDKGVVLTHIPIHEMSVREPRVTINIHGHLHTLTVNTVTVNHSKYFNASVEQTSYTPVSIEQVLYEKGHA